MAEIEFTELAIRVAAVLIRKFEGFYSHPYLCSAGVPTIGLGSTFYEDGRRVTLKDEPISRERAEALLQWHVRKIYLPAILNLCPGIDTPERLAAIIDWTYNLGMGNLRSSTLRKRILAQRWGDVPAEIKKWNKGGGRVLKGLTLRRQAEADLI